MTQTLRTALVMTADASGIVGEVKRTETALEAAERRARGVSDAMARIKAPSGGGIQQIVNSLTGVDREMGAARLSAAAFSRELEEQERAFRSLKGAVDPLWRAEQQFAAAQAQVNRALAAGVVGQEEAAGVLHRLEAQYEIAAAAARQLDAAQAGIGRGAFRAGGGVQQASLQIADFATQVGAGTAASVALGQQLPQLLAGFGVFGAVAGAAVAIGVPLAKMLFDTGGGADAAEEALKGLDTALERVSASLKLVRDNDLGGKFGPMAGNVRALATAMLELDRAAELKALSTALDSQLDQFKPGIMQRLFTPGSGDVRPDAVAAQNRSLEAANFDKLGAGIGFDEFEKRRAALMATAKAGNVPEVTRQINELWQAMKDGKPVADMNDELVTMLRTLGSIAMMTAEQEVPFNEAAQAVAGYERIVAEAAARQRELVELAEVRAIAEQRLAEAQGTGTAAAEAAARAGLAAVDEEIRRITDATGRVQALDQSFEDLKGTAGKVAFDQDAAVRAAVDEMARKLLEAKGNLQNLSDADLSALEAAMQRLAGWAGDLASGAAAAGSLTAKQMRGYQQYGETRAAAAGWVGNDALAASRAMIIRFEGKLDAARWDENHHRAGYGSDTITLPDGSTRPVTAGMQVTQDQMDRDLDRRIGLYHDELRKLVGPGVMAGFSAQQIASIASIQHNYGSIPGRIKPALQSGDAQLIAQAIAGLAMDYTRSERAQGKTGRPVNYNRRMEEAGAFGNVAFLEGRFSGELQARDDRAREAKRRQDEAAREAKRRADEDSRMRGSITTEMSRVAPGLERDIAAAEKWRDEAMAGLDKTKAGYEAFAADVEAIYQDRIAKAYEGDLARQDTWAAGILQGLQEIEDKTTTWAEFGQELVTSWSEAGQQAFIDLAKTGTANVDDLVNHTLDMFLKMIYQLAVQPLFNTIFNGIAGAVGLPMGGAGAGAVTVPTAHTGGTGVMRTYSRGNRPRGDERLAMLRDGEQVFTPRMLENAGAVVSALSAAAGQGGGSVAVDARPIISVINNSRAQIDGKVEETTGPDGKRQYRMVLDDAVATAVGVPGGKTQKTLGGRFGLKPGGIVR